MTRKEKIWEEIKVLQKQRSQIQDEIVKKWKEYYAENGKKDE